MAKRSKIDRALIRGRRVYLRHPMKSDLAEYLAVLSASEREMAPTNPTPPRGRHWNDAEGFERVRATCDDEQNQRHLICRRTDDAILGMANLNQIFRGPFQNAYMGWWLGTPYTGQGFATDGVTLCLKRAFTQLKLHRVEANILPHNRRSIALAKRVGFRAEGRSKRYLKIAGSWQDHRRFAMTIEDWREQV